MKRRNLTKTEKLNEDREERFKEDLSSREKKTEPVGKSYKYVGRRFIDLSCVCQQLADGCKVCKTEISPVHYEDETVTGLAGISHITDLRHNFTARSDTCFFVQQDYFNLNYWNALKESEKHVLYNNYWREYTVS